MKELEYFLPLNVQKRMQHESASKSPGKTMSHQKIASSSFMVPTVNSAFKEEGKKLTQ